MHILYVDESGDDGFAPGNVYTNPDAQSKVFIRTGLAIHDRRWRKLNQKITALKYKYKIPNSVELQSRTKSRRFIENLLVQFMKDLCMYNHFIL